MEVKEYLLSGKGVILGDVAALMWPDNKTANSYLSQKLHEKDNRRFTRKDALLAQKALKQLGIVLISLTVADKYE